MGKAHLALLLLMTFVPLRAFSQPVPPAPGVELPQAYFDRVAVDKNAFRFQRAWIQKAERAKTARQDFLRARRYPDAGPAAIPDALKSTIAVAGTIQVPVFLGKFSNTGASPYSASDLQSKLFTPPPALSVTGLYNEMSYGNVTLTGTVYDWVQVSAEDTYYEGGCNGICGSSRVGQYLREILQAKDPAVDFGLYDNDGPDGVPNSGDDDGYVDFVAFVHPETGGECGTTNIWSHRWVVGGWPEFGGEAWMTNDPRAGGGFIQVWDYTIQPMLGSENGCGAGIVEIGVFCHEFGHAFGLPDLYDTNGGSEGIGQWGLMGSGNWNRPANPAHMSAWSKTELGWVLPTEVGPVARTYTIHNVETTPEVFKLDVMEQKFSRKLVVSSYRLHCGLTAEEAGARGWPKGAGYGNEWDESVRREFSYDGTGPVTLEYDYMYHTEADYDFGYMKIEVGGAVSTLVAYDGFGAGHAVIDLTPYLSGGPPTSYRLIAQFRSDMWASDEDGDFDSGAASPFMIDNVSVTGGGESYFANFEQDEDGWYYDFGANPSKEYFLVENRNTTGAQFDQFLHGQGLAIWHVEQNMMAPGGLGNTGGVGIYNNTTIRGVTLEEADGRDHLLYKTNRGDGGDVYPGTSGKTAFNSQTTPNSRSHNGAQTHCLVENISAPGATMTATMRAGLILPVEILAFDAQPGSGGIELTWEIIWSETTVDGFKISRCVAGSTPCEFLQDGELIESERRSFLDDTVLPGTEYEYFLIVVYGGGSELASDVKRAKSPAGPSYVLSLRQNFPNPFAPTTRIAFSLPEPMQVLLRVYDPQGRKVITLIDKGFPGGMNDIEWDGRDEAGRRVANGVYFYRLETARGVLTRKMLVLK